MERLRLFTLDVSIIVLICFLLLTNRAKFQSFGQNLGVSTMQTKERDNSNSWLPYMIGVSGLTGIRHYLVLDTLKSINPPDSVLLRLDVESGDREVIWLIKDEPWPTVPGTVNYLGKISSIDQSPPVEYDNILQIITNCEDAITMTYKSFNDQREYFLRLSWMQGRQLW